MTIIEAGMIVGVPAGAIIGAVVARRHGAAGMIAGGFAGVIAGDAAGWLYAMLMIFLLSVARVLWRAECGYDLRATPEQCPECGAAGPLVGGQP